MNAQEIIDRLNEIETDNPGQNSAEVWAWVQSLDEWDDTATDRVDPSWSSDRFALKDGTVIRWDDEGKHWYEQR